MSAEQPAGKTSRYAARRLVWDLPLRIFHWLFAVGILASWGTAEFGFAWMPLHIRLGYAVMGLLLFRLIWGFVGPKHARFSSFLKGPAAVLRYARGLTGINKGPPRIGLPIIGHNPLGALMVILMLLLVAIQVGSGLFATDDITWAGPYNPAVSSATAAKLTALHDWNFNCILAAMALHIAAIGYYAWVKRENLVTPMITGWKAAEVVPMDDAITSSELWKACIALAASTGLVFWVISAAPAANASNF